MSDCFAAIRLERLVGDPAAGCYGALYPGGGDQYNQFRDRGQDCYALSGSRLVRDSLACMTPEEALALALELHGDQVDKLGEDYVDGHLRRVQAAVSSHNDSVLSIAAALHDVLEDTKTKPEKLFSKGVPLEAVRVIGIVTKRYNEHGEEGYGLFIERIIASGNRNAIVLKLADVNDHLRPVPDGPGADVVARRVPRYELAQRKLLEALRG